MSYETQSPKAFQRGRRLARKPEEKGLKFDRINQTVFEEKNLTLHPTKGYRRVSTVATVCSDIIQGLFKGKKISMQEQGQQVKLAHQSQYQNKSLFRKLRRTKP